MEYPRLLELIQTDTDKAINLIVNSREQSDWEKCIEQFDSSKHEITKRKDKYIWVDDPNTEKEDAPKIQVTVKTAKLPLAYQELIVNQSVAFLCGNPIEMDCSPKKNEGENAPKTIEENLRDVLKKTIDDNKMVYLDKEICTILFTEKEVAELWHIEKADPDYWAGTANASKTIPIKTEGDTVPVPSAVKARLKIISHSRGDSLYPVYNSVDDMIAFGRGYTLKDDDGKDENHFDLYTDENLYQWTQKDGNGWGEPETTENPLGKIPVIYHSKKKTEWENVNPLIIRKEWSISHHGDINDYNAAPKTVVTGEIKGWSKKGEAGETMQLEPGAKVEKLAWDAAPESIKLEQETLRSNIFELSESIDWVQLRNKIGGGAPSGYAIKLMFTPAHMKASRNEEIYGKGVQRRYNLLKAIMAFINPVLKPALVMQITPKFKYFLPENPQEAIDLLNSAVMGGIQSKETAIRQNPLIEDADKELELIKAEQEAQAEAQNSSTALDVLMGGRNKGAA